MGCSLVLNNMFQMGADIDWFGTTGRSPHSLHPWISIKTEMEPSWTVTTITVLTAATLELLPPWNSHSILLALFEFLVFYIHLSGITVKCVWLNCALLEGRSGAWLSFNPHPASRHSLSLTMVPWKTIASASSIASSERPYHSACLSAPYLTAD